MVKPLSKAEAFSNAFGAGMSVVNALRETPIWPIIETIDNTLDAIENQRSVTEYRKSVWRTVEVYKALQKAAGIVQVRGSAAAMQAIELMDTMINQHKTGSGRDTARDTWADWLRTFEPRRHLKRSQRRD